MPRRSIVTSATTKCSWDFHLILFDCFASCFVLSIFVLFSFLKVFVCVFFPLHAFIVVTFKKFKDAPSSPTQTDVVAASRKRKKPGLRKCLHFL